METVGTEIESRHEDFFVRKKEAYNCVELDDSEKA